jgi:hypothetical protein
MEKGIRQMGQRRYTELRKELDKWGNDVIQN